MLKKYIIILFLILLISSCFSESNKLVTNTGILNQNFSGNITNSGNIIEENSFSGTGNNSETTFNSGILDDDDLNSYEENKEKLNKDMTSLDKSTNLSDIKVTKKPIIKTSKKEINEQNVDAIEKDLEKELDSLIDLINENE